MFEIFKDSQTWRFSSGFVRFGEDVLDLQDLLRFLEFLKIFMIF